MSAFVRGIYWLGYITGWPGPVGLRTGAERVSSPIYGSALKIVGFPIGGGANAGCADAAEVSAVSLPEEVHTRGLNFGSYFIRSCRHPLRVAVAPGEPQAADRRRHWQYLGHHRRLPVRPRHPQQCPRGAYPELPSTTSHAAHGVRGSDRGREQGRPSELGGS